MPSLAPRIDTLESTPTFSGQASFAAGSAAAPSLRFTVDPTTGLYRIGAGSIGFSSAGVAVGSIGVSWTMGAVAGGGNHVIYGRDGNPASFTSSVYIQSSNAANSVRLGFGIYETGDYAWIQSLETDTANPKGLKLFTGSIEAFSYNASGACTFGASGASGTKVSVNNSSGSMPSICNSRTMSVYNDTNSFGIQAVSGSASYSGVILSVYAIRASSNAFNFISCVNGDGTSYNVTNAFVVAGDGTVRAGDSGTFGIASTGEHRFYSSIDQTSFGSVDVFDTRTQAAGVGGMITLSGFKIAQTNGAIYAGIKGSKYNATSNNELGQLKFYSSDGSSLKEGGYLDPYSGWTFGLALGNTAPSLPFKPLIIQTPITTTVIGYTKFFKFGAGTTVIDLVTISSASWDSGHNIDVEVQVTNIATNAYSVARGHARGIGTTSVNTITTAMVATDANGGLAVGTLAWTAGTGAATLQYTPPTNTDYTNYEITITNRKFPFTLP